MIVMKDDLRRHADGLTAEEASELWRGIREQAFRPRRSWRTVWAVGGSLAVATAALLVFVIARGPNLDVLPREPLPAGPITGPALVQDEGHEAEEAATAGRLVDESEPAVVEDSDRVRPDARPAGSAAAEAGRAHVSGAKRVLVEKPDNAKSPIEIVAPSKTPADAGESTPVEAVARPEASGPSAAEKRPGERDATRLAGAAREKHQESVPAADVAFESHPSKKVAGEEPAVSERILGGETAAVPFAARGESPGAGAIKGRITDVESGVGIPYANVAVLGTRMGTASKADGTYAILNVPSGTYTLEVMAMGYADVVREGVAVRADGTTVVNIELRAVVFTDAIPGLDAGERKGVVHLESSAAQRALTIRTQHTHVRGGRSSKTGYVADRSLPSRVYEESPYPMAHGGEVPPNGEPVDAMFFKHYGVNPFIAAEDDNLSTFAIDVDTGSYTVCRRYLSEGNLPPPESVRVEEFVNFFPHDYEPPRTGDFLIHVEAAPSRFGENLTLLRVGLQGRVVREAERKPAHLVFVVDTSGSMGRENRLGLVKRALTVLLDQMGRGDRVGVVEYGSRARVVLRPTAVAHREDIIEAIDDLYAHGSTYAEEGLRLGYEMADRAYDPEVNNRVILCSDGVANVGRTGADGILGTVKQAARRGIYLTAVGFGMGNYNDVLMEQLADHGDGQYYYVDHMPEARRVFLENLTGTLQTIARDVKVQVEFNRHAVDRYRLLGYENRDVADEDFRNDRVDAGEVGSGHQVTALYELHLKRGSASRTVATVRLRWETPESGDVTEIEEHLEGSQVKGRFEDASRSLRCDAAVAEFAEILRRSYWARDGNLRDVERLVDALAADREAGGEIAELLDLIRRASEEWKEEVYTNEWRDQGSGWEDSNER